MLNLTTQLLFSAKSHFSPPPVKKKSLREREYLRLDEINAMMKAARKVGRHGLRDSTIILEMFRHGLRTAELVALRWDYVDLKGGYIDIHRVKHGHDSIHPLRSPELRALHELKRKYPESSYVFVSERHACGYYLASQGHDTRAIQAYLGHKNIHYTVRYTDISPHRFESFWQD